MGCHVRVRGTIKKEDVNTAVFLAVCWVERQITYLVNTVGLEDILQNFEVGEVLVFLPARSSATNKSISKLETMNQHGPKKHDIYHLSRKVAALTWLAS